MNDKNCNKKINKKKKKKKAGEKKKQNWIYVE